jgi:hypothetical protein
LGRQDCDSAAEPFSSSSRRAILSSVIVVVLGFRLCRDNPTLARITAVAAGGPPPQDSRRSLRLASQGPPTPRLGAQSLPARRREEL